MMGYFVTYIHKHQNMFLYDLITGLSGLGFRSVQDAMGVINMIAASMGLPQPFRIMNKPCMSVRAAAPGPLVAPRIVNKKAVCIGINYTNTANELKGCINDARCLKSMLMGQYVYKDENVRMLLDTQGFLYPTRANIISAIRWLLADAKAGDSLFFSYSGHGTHVKDTNKDEADGQDEAMYCLDGLILDDFINSELLAKVPEGVRLTCLFDCCHSGTIGDLQYCYRYTPKNKLNQFTMTMENVPAVKGDIVLYSGCLDPQTAADSNFNGKWVKGEDGKTKLVWGEGNGAFTWYFIQALKVRKYNVSCADVLRDVVALLSRNKFTQETQFTCSRPDMIAKPFTI